MKRNDKGLILHLIDSFNHAINGIIIAVKIERNIKIHYFMAILVLLSTLFFEFTKVEFVLILFSISLVIVAELLNSAIEKSIDMVQPEYHPLAKIAKDMAAGSVLIAAINSLFVGYILFFDKLNLLGGALLFSITNSPMHLTIVAILLVTILTLGLKAVFKKFSDGTHLHGGAVSGHASVAFCAATIVATIGNNSIVTVLVYLLAILVGQSRIEGKIHSTFEVVTGAILGTLVGILIFQLLQ